MSLQRYIQRLLVGMTLILALSSCIYDHYSDDEDITGEKPDDMLLVLHITPIATRGETTDVVEKIMSLRIVILNTTEGEEGGEVTTIEYNKKIFFNNDNDKADGFNYDLTWRTKPGTKQFYFFANEERVNTICYQKSEQETDLPTVLTDLLNIYQPIEDSDNEEAIADKQQKAAKFNEVINSVYFSPKYEINENNEIYLPYTSYYGGIKVTEAEDKSSGFFESEDMPETMYLVPVATKFYFSFYNYHKNDVEIQKLTIEQTDSENFLLGQVADGEQTKVFNSNPDEPGKNKSYYWVDWLAMVAGKTHSTTNNDAINEQYGWISDYSMPTSSKQSVQTLIGKVDDTDDRGLVGGRQRMGKGTIKACESIEGVDGSLEDTAGELFLGPYYFPESRYMVEYTVKDDENKDVTVKEQQYQLGLYLHDKEVDSSTSNDLDTELVIDKVKSLFRNTCVLIQITMRRGYVEIYAEPYPWDHKEVDGWADGGSIIP